MNYTNIGEGFEGRDSLKSGVKGKLSEAIQHVRLSLQTDLSGRLLLAQGRTTMTANKLALIRSL